MAVIQITRGTAALPPDLERQFVRTHGREMNEEERKFFGLPRKPKGRRSAEREYEKVPQAA